MTLTSRTFALDVAGLDFEQLKLFCSILDIPGPPDPYNMVHQRVIHSTLINHIKNYLAVISKHLFDNVLQHVGSKTVISIITDGIYQNWVM